MIEMTPDGAAVTMAHILDTDGGFFCLQGSSEAVQKMEVTLILKLSDSFG